MKRLLRVGYYLLVAVVITIAILLALSFFNLTGTYEIKVVKSGSMAPAIKTGSLVLIQPTIAYQEGEIITYGRDTKTEVPTTHRITKVRVENGRRLYTTQGDANDDPDPREVTPAEIRLRKRYLTEGDRSRAKRSDLKS